MENSSKIKKTVSYQKVPWELLCAPHSSPTESAALLRPEEIRNFRAQITKPLSLYWFKNRNLNFSDNRAAAALCTFFGSDSIDLTEHKSFTVAGLSCEYSSCLTFEPRFKAVLSDRHFGRVVPRANLRIYRLEIDILSLPKLLAINTVIVFLALIFNILLLGLFFYGSAVFILFLKEPYQVTEFATRRIEIGLGLLGFLLVLTILVRRTVLDLLERRSKRRKIN